MADTTYYELGTAVYKEDGTGYTYNDSTINHFTWHSDEDQETVTYEDDGETLVFDVVEKEKDEMRFYRAETLTIDSVSHLLENHSHIVRVEE